MNLHLTQTHKQNMITRFIKEARQTCPQCGGQGIRANGGVELPCNCRAVATPQSECATCQSGRPCAKHGTNHTRREVKATGPNGCYACVTGRECKLHPNAEWTGDTGDYDSFCADDVMPNGWPM